MKNLPRLAIVGLAFVALLVTGCGKQHASADPVEQAKSLKSASPQVQAAWELAVEAAKTNGYAIAYLTLRQLQGQAELTPEQRAAIDAKLTLVNDTMLAAMQKGDPEAKKAYEEIKKRWRQN